MTRPRLEVGRRSDLERPWKLPSEADSSEVELGWDYTPEEALDGDYTRCHVGFHRRRRDWLPDAVETQTAPDEPGV